MAKKLGKGGNGTFLGLEISVISHTYTGANDVQETTGTGSDGDTEYIPGYNDRKGSMEFNVDFATTQLDVMLEGAVGTLSLKLADTAKTKTGTAILTNVEETNAAKSVVTMKADFQFTGPVVRT